MSSLSDGLTGLSHVTPLFLVAAALTLVFRATGLVDFSQAALACLAASLATFLAGRLPIDPVAAIVVPPCLAAILGATIDVTLFRTLDRASLLARLLVALGLFIFVHDLAGLLSAPPAVLRPAWSGAIVMVGSAPVPVVTIAVAATAPVAFGLLHLLSRTRSAHRRSLMVALAAALSGLAGTLPLLAPQGHGFPSGGADLDLLADALLVVLLGGLGSLSGAFLAALLVALLETATAGLFPDAALVLPLAITGIVLLVRPLGLLGRAIPAPLQQADTLLIRPAPSSAKLLLVAVLLVALAAPVLAGPAALPLVTGAAIAALLAASLHLLVGPGGIPSLGHVAFFAIGTFAAAAIAVAGAQTIPLPLLMAASLAVGPLAAGSAALLLGTVLARLPPAALAMLTLVVARLAWSVGARLPWPNVQTSPVQAPPVWLTVGLCLGATLLLRRVSFAPFGYALRAARDNPVRAAAIGLPMPALRLAAFTLAGVGAGLAGAIAAIAGSAIVGAVPTLDRSADTLLMLALGGPQAMAAPLVGAVAYTGLVAALPASNLWPNLWANLWPNLWPLLLGPALIALTLLLPDGIAGTSIRRWRRAP